MLVQDEKDDVLYAPRELNDNHIYPTMLPWPCGRAEEIWAATGEAKAIQEPKRSQSFAVYVAVPLE